MPEATEAGETAASGGAAVLGQSLEAMAAFEATGPRQLSFAKGDTLTAIKTAKQWYVARDCDGNEGLVPSNFVRLQDGGAAAAARRRDSRAGKRGRRRQRVHLQRERQHRADSFVLGNGRTSAPPS